MPPPFTRLFSPVSPGPTRASASLLSAAGSALRRGGFSGDVSSLAGRTLRGAQGGRPIGLDSQESRLFNRGFEDGKIGLGIAVSGIDEAHAVLDGLRRSVIAAATAKAQVRSDLPYAFGIHYGRHRSGRLARRAGGSFSLLGALLAVTPRASGEIAAALPHGPRAVQAAVQNLAQGLLNETRNREIVRTGRLRDSYYVVRPAATNPRAQRLGGTYLRRSGD